ncbi:hypothetical protein OK016_27555 [Vibrio chagasii]|nr:hypothetical protein [Vibrio chagasii]
MIGCIDFAVVSTSTLASKLLCSRDHVSRYFVNDINARVINIPLRHWREDCWARNVLPIIEETSITSAMRIGTTPAVEFAVH